MSQGGSEVRYRANTSGANAKGRSRFGLDEEPESASPAPGPPPDLVFGTSSAEWKGSQACFYMFVAISMTWLLCYSVSWVSIELLLRTTSN